MKKPTIEEIAEYCGNQQEAILFYNYYESQGWKVGKNPMKNWKSAISGWMQRNQKRAESNKTAIEKVASNKSNKFIDRLWKRMTEIYGHKWVSSYGETPTKPWIEAIDNLHPDQIKHGLNAVLNNGESWPPSLTEFLKLCRDKPKITITKTRMTKKEILAERERIKPLIECEVNKIYSILNKNTKSIENIN